MLRLAEHGVPPAEQQGMDPYLLDALYDLIRAEAVARAMDAAEAAAGAER